MSARTWVAIASGTAVTLLLAWVVPFVLFAYLPSTLAYQWTTIRGTDGSSIDLGRNWLIDWCKAWPSGARAGERSWPPRSRPGIALPDPEASAEWDRIDTALVGWPTRAFASEAWFPAENGGTGTPIFRWNIHLERIGSGEALVPLRPLWGGLALDIAAWSSAFWLGLALPSSVQRGLRRRRGRCGLCGHPMVGQARCLECGSA